jgi:methylated-DNA-[protein]-cysteine S-methyltransferase
MDNERLFYLHLDTPVGKLLLIATSVGLLRVVYPTENGDEILGQIARITRLSTLHAHNQLDDAATEIAQYFNRRRQYFDIPLDKRLTQGFYRSVLDQVVKIPYGTTASYAAVAATTGSPKATRAVGSACANNPLPIVIPCHRVVRSDGSKGGYLGGEDAKNLLLDLEKTP